VNACAHISHCNVGTYLVLCRVWLHKINAAVDRAFYGQIS